MWSRAQNRSWAVCMGSTSRITLRRSCGRDPCPCVRVLYELGHDPVMQLTCRDRNRIAMQSDLMGAHMLGIRNILCLTGDYPTVGDHKDAKPVYDLDSVQVMQLVTG